jgi:hypothetical protein
MVAVALGALAGMAAAAVLPQRESPVAARAAGTSQLRAFGVHSSQKSAVRDPKMDSSLADISRHLSHVRAASAIQDLHALHPAARFAMSASGQPMVLIDAVTLGDAGKLRSSLEALGLERSAQFKNDVSGWLPVSRLSAATALGELHAVRAAMPRTRVGAVTTQGDFAQNSDLVRSENALDGTGVTVGILSDSYDCYSVYASNNVPASGNAGYANNGFNTTAAEDMSSADLPSSVNVLEDATCMQYGAPLQLPFGDEGRAMMQVVHDVAPGAGLAFYTAENGEADFANGIEALASAGAKIVADDVGYFDEPFFQDGLIAQAVNTVQATGVTYLSAAGNNGNLAYDNTNPNFTAVASGGANNGEHVLNFNQGSGAASTTLPVTVPPLIPGEYVAIVLEWDQPYVTGAPNSGGATSQLDLCLTNVHGNDDIYDDNLNVLSTDCTGANTLGQDPVQIIIVGNPANATGNSGQTTFDIMVGIVGSSTKPGRIKVAVEDDGAGSTINSYATNTGTIQGHPSATGAAAVGAAFYFQTPNCVQTLALESFSSEGGTPILFDQNGTRLASAQNRQKPDFVGPDGGNDTFLGFTLTGSQDPTTGTTVSECKNDQNFPNFFGTSAATPHVAGIAALFLQANPSLTPANIVSYLSQTALPMTEGANYDGAGFVQADLAAQKVPALIPAAPTLSLSASAVTVNSPVTITWKSYNNQGCTASGNWTGSQAASGSQTLTPSTAGTQTYKLACTNAAGTSATASISLTVNPLPPAPTISVAPTSITVGQSATITWSSTGASGCTASGSWSGAQAASGSMVVTPGASGTNTYTLACSNSNGSSPSASATLTVNAASSSHGGGALDARTLAALALLSLLSVASRLRRRSGVATKRRSSYPRAH